MLNTVLLRSSLFSLFFFSATSIFAPPGFAASDVSRPNGPVIVIGADAMTFDLIDPMIKAGKLPNIKRLIQKGASGVLKSEKPMRSPALWTTMATGQPRKVHKIYDFVTGSSYWPKREREKEQRLVTSDMRQSRAIWNFATSGGKRSLVVGWLNTWPAEELNGVMVAPYVALGERRQTSIKGKIYKNAKNQTYPPELFETLQDKIVRANSVSPKTVARILDVPPKGARIYKDIPKLKRYLYTARWSLAGTATNLELVKSLSKKTDYDLVMTYFDGTDTLAHRFWLMRQPLPTIRKRLSHFGIPPKYAEEMKRRFGMSVENFYVVIDEAIGDLWKEFGDDATIIVLSDHGFGDHTRPKYYSKDVPFDGEHKENGIILVAGPNIKSGKISPRTQYDIAPTVLHLMGLPVPQEMPGKVAMSLFPETYAANHKPVYSDVPVDRPSASRKKKKAKKKKANTHFEDTEIERLRSLGYVQ